LTNKFSYGIFILKLKIGLKEEKKMNSREQQRWNGHVADSYDRELQTTPEDYEDMAREQERREEIRSQKEEWDWECKRDQELTDPKEKVIVEPEKSWFQMKETDEQKEEREWREWFRRDTDRHWNRKYSW
jgi:hypothetical protein